MTHILITGANRGIGLGFVKKYIEKNAHVLCTTRDILGSKELLACKEEYPRNIEIFEIDLLKENAAVTLANFLKDRPIDILISNAGVGSSNQHFEAVSLKPWLNVLKINLIAPLMITQAVIQNVKKVQLRKYISLALSLVK